MSLNGEWQFEIDKEADGDSRGLTFGKELASKIIVPFCPESKLSGLGYGNTLKLKDVWYRRTFDLPAVMKGQRVRIHFGGVDYRSWVYINGQLVGMHVGENVQFSFDISKFLKDGANEVVVKVIDDMWSGLQPCGKQSGDKSYSCFYTRTTGIWQPVWLEAVGSSFVENISVVPDPDHGRVLIDAKINGADTDLALTVEAFAGDELVGSETSTGPGQNRLVINLKSVKLWEPGAPFLYDLKFTLVSGKEKIDQLQSYFGLRKIAIDGRKVLINGKPVFQRLILDQGFYPDGLWTAPSDEALKQDIVMSMACGYNGARLHQKVFEPRFLYWADKLGYLVWGEYPNAGYGNGPKNLDEFYFRYKGTIDAMLDNPNLFGFCYTQLTDIEQERNGLYYYNRKPKFDVRKLHEITSRQAAYERKEAQAPPPSMHILTAKWKVLVGAQQDGKLSTRYQYTTENPAEGWLKDGFDDKAWQSGLAPFGNGNGSKTEWKTPEIYFRKTFEYDGADLKNGAVVIRHNDNTEIYINGEKIIAVDGSKGYYLILTTDLMKKVLKKGTNTIAVHSHEGGQGQWIDFAVLAE